MRPTQRRELPCGCEARPNLCSFNGNSANAPAPASRSLSVVADVRVLVLPLNRPPVQFSAAGENPDVTNVEYGATVFNHSSRTKVKSADERVHAENLRHGSPLDYRAPRPPKDHFRCLEQNE